MTDTLSKQERSARMALIGAKNTKPEILVRRLLSSSGFRYRLHRKDLPGHPDIAFVSKRAVIFVHGCFWHHHPNCAKARIPKSRKSYWVPKLKGNRERDIRNLALLSKSGWRAFVVWECELANPTKTHNKLKRFLGAQK